jgi:hypothetical protein
MSEVSPPVGSLNLKKSFSKKVLSLRESNIFIWEKSWEVFEKEAMFPMWRPNPLEKG